MGVIATSDGLSPGLERLEVDQIVEVAVLNDMRLLLAPVEIARGGEHNSATFRIIQQPASLDGYVCRAEVETSEGTTYRLVDANGEFSLTSDIAVPGIGQLQLVYSDGDAVIRKSYPARFHVTRSINAVDESDPEFQNGLAQMQQAAFTQVIGGDASARFFNISGGFVGEVIYPPGQGGGLDEATANLLYVRQDGASIMSASLRMVPSTSIDDPIGVFVGGRQASIYWQNALQLRRGAAGEPVQVADVNGNNASEILTRQVGDLLYLSQDVASATYLDRSGGQMTGPFISAPGGGLTNPGLAIGDNATGFFRAGGTLLLSVGGALYCQWLASPPSQMVTVPLNMAANPITNVADPRDGTPGAQDAANRRYVDAAIAAAPRPVVLAARAYIGTEVTVGSAPQAFFNQPFFTNDNAQRTILVTAYPQFASGTNGAFYDLEYTINTAPGVIEVLSVYPTPNGYMGGGASVAFAMNVTPASSQIQVSLSVREISNNVGAIVQIGSRATQRTTIVIQEMTG